MAELKKKSASGAVVYTFFLLAYILVGAIAIYFGLRLLWTYALEYEQAQPSKVMDVYIDGLNENLFDDSVAQTISDMPHPFQTDEEVRALVQEMFSSELTYMRALGGDGENSLVYAILCDGNSFGTVYLTRDQAYAGKVKFGKLPWKIEREEFDFSGLYSTMDITVPQSYTVVLNGQTLGPEYIVNSGIHYDVLEEYYEDFPQLPTKVTYHVDHILGHLTPVLYDDLGNLTELNLLRDDGQFIRPIDDATYARLEQFAIAFSDPYLHMSSNTIDPNAGFRELEPYLIPEGDLVQRMRASALDGYGWAHTTSYAFEGAQLINAISLGDGYYSIDIHAQTVITYPGKGDNGIVHDNNGLKVLVVEYEGGFRAVTVERYQA